MIIAAVESILVRFWYYMTREISSTFSRIKGQTSIATEQCFKRALNPCGRIGKKKYN